MVEEKPIEKPYSLNKFRIPKKKSIDSSDKESDKKVNVKSEVVEKSKKAEKAIVEESKQPQTANVGGCVCSTGCNCWCLSFFL